MTMAIQVDLRDQFGPVRDQGERPTCMAFAASDAHAAARPDWKPLSCEYAYFHALNRDGGLPHEGATPRGMLETIREDGQPPESEWPYLKAVPSDIATWKPPAKAEPLFRRGSNCGKMNCGEIKTQLDTGKPVLLTMCLSNAFFSPDEDGLIAANEPPDPHRRHAVIAVGHGEKAGQRVFLIRNSWGDNWGIGGYAWVTYSYMEDKVNETAEMTRDLSNVSGNTDSADMRSSVA